MGGRPALCRLAAHAADADLVAGGLLLDLKTSARPELQLTDIFQLAAYALMDSRDQYRLDTAGIFLARYGHRRLPGIAELDVPLAGAERRGGGGAQPVQLGGADGGLVAFGEGTFEIAFCALGAAAQVVAGLAEDGQLRLPGEPVSTCSASPTNSSRSGTANKHAGTAEPPTWSPPHATAA